MSRLPERGGAGLPIQQSTCTERRANQLTQLLHGKGEEIAIRPRVVFTRPAKVNGRGARERDPT